jgi:hypothetical protein
MRHLTGQQALTALRRRAPIEQMLSENLDSASFSWLEARPSGQGFALRLRHTLDDGSESFLDVYEFRSVDEDDYLGEGVLVGEYPDEASLLQAAVEVESAHRGRCGRRMYSGPPDQAGLSKKPDVS